MLRPQLRPHTNHGSHTELLAYFFGEVRVFEVGIFFVVDGEAGGGVVCVAPDLAGDFEGGLVVGALEGEVLQGRTHPCLMPVGHLLHSLFFFIFFLLSKLQQKWPEERMPA
jgi:hypothetical protein